MAASQLPSFRLLLLLLLLLLPIVCLQGRWLQ
jgi:hypothetical protein